MILAKPNNPNIEWTDGAIPFARNETHDKVVEMMEKEPRGKVLDVPTGTGILARRLLKAGLEVSCCDVPPYAIVAGNPAQVIRHRFGVETMQTLLKIKGWDWPDEKVEENVHLICSDSIDSFIKTFG